MMITKKYTVVFNQKDGIVPLILSIDKAICKKFWLTPTSNTSRKGDNTFVLKTPDADVHIDTRKEFIQQAGLISGITSATFNGAYRRPFLPLGTVHNVWVGARPTLSASMRDALLAIARNKQQKPEPDEWEITLYVGKMGKNLAFIDRAVQVVEEILAPHRPTPEATPTATPQQAKKLYNS